MILEYSPVLGWIEDDTCIPPAEALALIPYASRSRVVCTLSDYHDYQMAFRYSNEDPGLAHCASFTPRRGHSRAHDAAVWRTSGATIDAAIEDAEAKMHVLFVTNDKEG